MFAASSVTSSPNADFDVRTEVQTIDERRRLEVAAEIELIRINRDPAADAAVLRHGRHRRKNYESE